MISWSYPLLSNPSGDGSSVPEGGTPPDFSGAEVPQLRYATFARDPATRNLEFPLRVIRGPAAVQQFVENRFLMVLGEWFLDQRQGTPWREQVLRKGATPPMVSGLFRQILSGTLGVSSVAKMACTLERPTRTLIANFEALLEDGSILRNIDHPYILE